MFGCDLPQQLGRSIGARELAAQSLTIQSHKRTAPDPEVEPGDYIPAFGQKGFAFIYQSKSVAKKKLLPRSEPACFVGMESKTRLIRVYLPSRRVSKLFAAQTFA